MIPARDPAMRRVLPQRYAPRSSRSSPGPAHSGVIVLAAALVVLQIALRGWALYPSWFYLDDFQMLDDARRQGLGPALLLEPYDSQFMPVGRFAAWVVTQGGLVDWRLAATVTLALQLLAGLACLWMLVTLFGTRWLVLVPLALYLSTAMTMPALMWWAASLNALPLQLCFFAGVAVWVRYLRTRRIVWLIVSLVVITLGLGAYVKSLLILPVLAALAVGWFTSGGPRDRVVQTLRQWWPAALSGAVLSAGFLTYYLLNVPSLATGSPAPVAVELARSMLGRSLPVGLLGGPWSWSRLNPPVGLADPPGWAVVLAWGVIAATALVLALRRRRTGRVWVLVALYALGSYLLLLLTRAPVVGSIAGLEYRYLTDVACVAALGLGLLLMPLREGEEGTVARRSPRPPSGAAEAERTARRTAAVVATLTSALVVSGVASSVAYAQIWHEDNPGEVFLRASQASLRGEGAVDVADTVVPDNVIPGYLYPFNTSVRLLPIVADNVRFPEVTRRLSVLGQDGELRQGLVAPTTTSRRGPDGDCGWKVGSEPVVVPLRSTAFDYTWWVRIGYLSSAEDTMTIALADRAFEVDVQEGLHSVFLNITGEVDEVAFSGLEQATVCVDPIEVGTAVAGGPR